MTVRCAVCGKFIGYGEDYVFEFEPLSEFGPEKIEHIHIACDAQAIEARRAATGNTDAVHKSAVPEGNAP